MILELADHLISEPIGIAKDVYVTVGKFQFPPDFVVVDFEPDPRVPLILGRSFLKTSRALIDVYEGEITLRVGKKAITFNLDQTSRYTANYNHMTAKRIDVIELANQTTLEDKSSNGFAAALAILVTGASQSKQHGFGLLPLDVLCDLAEGITLGPEFLLLSCVFFLASYKLIEGGVSCCLELSVGEEDLLTLEVPVVKNSSYKGPNRRSNSCFDGAVVSAEGETFFKLGHRARRCHSLHLCRWRTRPEVLLATDVSDISLIS
ncbi:reverse transcriptase domain-containing protein [Tanacetum coccineum]